MNDVRELLAAGMAAYQSGRHGDAGRFFSAVLQTAPRNSDALQGLGVMHYQAGNLDRALELLEAALRASPDKAEIHTNLGATLRAMEEPDRAIASFQRATELAPRDPMMKVNLGLALHDEDKHREAAEVFRQGIRDDPQCAPAYLGLGHSLMQIESEEAERYFLKALAIDPKLRNAHIWLHTLLIARGRAAEALDRIERFFTLFPSDMEAIAQKAIALRELGRAQEAESIVDFRLLKKFRIEPPEGFDSIGAFNQALERHIRNHPNLTSRVRVHATTNGMRVNKLLAPPKGPVALLEEKIRSLLGPYWDGMPKNLCHPYTALSQPATVHMYAWAILLRAQGYELPHIHPTGRISGVYYVSLPDAVKQAGKGNQDGWIEFGEPQPSYKVRRIPPLHPVKPEEGSMLLFPSYFWHRTIPFDDPNERISIAFDVIVQAPQRR